MPMLKGYEAIRAVVARAIARAGVSMCRLEDLLPDAEWQHWLVRSVRRAKLALADITDHNPFVMYELGLIHNRRLPALLIVNSRNARIPATVLGSPFLSYDEENLPQFEEILVAAMRRMVRRHEPSRHLATSSTSFSCRGQYPQALALLKSFQEETSILVEPVAPDEFMTRIKVAEARGDMGPGDDTEEEAAWYLLPRIVRNSDEVEVMRALATWVDSRRFPTGRPGCS